MREVVTDGLEGYVVPVRDAGGIAHALSRLAAATAPERRAMGTAARARVEREFALRDQISQWLTLFGNLVERTRTRVAAPSFSFTANPAPTARPQPQVSR